MTETVSILIAGAGTGAWANAGDEAILTAMLQDLRRTIPNATFGVVSANPPGTLARHGVQEIPYDDIGRLLEASRNASLLILGGGGLFFDYWGFPENEILTPAHAGLSFYAGFALLATLAQRPLMIYAAGVGPLQSESGRRFTRFAFEQASVVTVRDSGSRDLLESLEIEQVELTADPAFTLEPLHSDRLAALLPDQAGPMRIAIAIRDWEESIEQSEWESELAAGLDEVRRSRDTEVVMIPFHREVGGASGDGEVLNRLRGRLGHPGRVTMIPEDLLPEEKSAAIGRCDLLVAMRLHSAIFAASQGVPAIGLSYDPKVASLFGELGLENEVLSMSFKGRELAAAIRRADEKRVTLGKRSSEPASPFRKAAARNAELAARAIASGYAPRPASPLTQEFMRSVIFSQTGQIQRLQETVRSRDEAIEWLEGEVRAKRS